MGTIPPLYSMTVGLPILVLLFEYRRNERAILLPADRNANVIKKEQRERNCDKVKQNAMLK